MADLRTVEKIEYGAASAVRVVLNPDIYAELSKRFIAFDTETTGLDPENDRIVELGAVMFENGAPTSSYQSYVNPGIRILPEVSSLNHITDEVLHVAPTEKDIYPELLKFLGDASAGKTMICGHVAAFDLSFLCRALDRLGIEANFRFVDTRQFSVHISELEHHSLAAVAEYLDIPHENAHHAKEDALTSGRILAKMLERHEGYQII